MENMMEHARYASVGAGGARTRLASDLVMAGGLGFLSGVLPVDLGNDATALAEFVEDQVAKVLANMEAMLGQHGMSRERVVSVRVNLVDFARFHERVDEAYAGFFAPGRLPTRSVVGVTRLPRGALVSMDFVIAAPPT